MKKLLLLTILAAAGSGLWAHGTVYNILSDRTLKIEAKFDTGEPFSRSTVLVFPPGESDPAYSLMTDEQGIFYFTPDREGTWIIQVRGEGGHGLRINLPVDAAMAAGIQGTNSLNWLQKILMVLCVVWGASGTALYFRKKK